MTPSALRKALLLPACLLAAQTTSTADADDVLVSFRSLTPEVALEMAEAALASCREDDLQVAVAVVDRMGVVQVVLRDRYAGPHTPETAERLAYTAVSFRTDTLSLVANTSPSDDRAGARHIDNVLMIGGGIPVRAAGSIVGGIGISGAPDGQANHDCAEAGVAAVRAKLELAE